MSSHLSVQDLSASLDGVLSGPALEQLVAHLAGCHACRDAQSRLAKHDDALRRLLAHDPDDRTMDELARRSETLVAAIVRGTPEPPIVTSAPLAEEEDPDAPLEPPLAPDLARPGERATAGGFGIIGFRPPVPTYAPPSDPDEVRRLIESLEKGNAGLDPANVRANVPANEPLVEPLGEPLREPLDEPAGPSFDRVEQPGMGESARRDDRHDGPRADAPRAIAPRTEAPPIPSGPAAPSGRGFAHGGAWSADPPYHDQVHPAEAARFSAPAAGSDPMSREPRREPAWSRMGLEPDPLDPGTYRQPITDPFPIYARRPPAGGRNRMRSQIMRASLVSALATVGGLLALVLVLRPSSLATDHAGARPAGSLLGVRLPPVLLTPHAHDDTSTRTPSAVVGSPDVRDAATRGAVDTRVPRVSAADSSRAAAGDGPHAERICGQVVNMAGEPVADVVISVLGAAATRPGPSPVRSDEQGRFCLSATSGPHVVVIERAGLSQRITVG
ncbi:MAG: hypothetical protein E6J87_19215, partial [Deltaproteobacteria bacterium]